MAPSTIIVQGLFRKPFFLKCQLFCQNGFHLWKMRWLMILWNVTNILTVVWFYFLSLFYIATKSPLLMFLTPVYSFGSSARVLPLFVAVSFHEKITFHSAAAAIVSSSTLRVEELDDENRHWGAGKIHFPGFSDRYCWISSSSVNSGRAMSSILSTWLVGWVSSSSSISHSGMANFWTGLMILESFWILLFWVGL